MDNMICKKCGSKNIMGVEYFDPSGKTIPYEHQYDGISEWDCLDCGYREGRWSKKQLKDGEYEKR